MPCGISILLMEIAPQWMDARELDDAWPSVLFAAGVLMILGSIFLLVFVYRMWKALAACAPRTTPGLAVGLLFVPLLNLYWIFRVFWGWTRDYNRHAREKSAALPRMPEGVALALCIVTIFRALLLKSEVLRGQLSAVSFVLIGVFVACACDGMNALASAD